VAGQEIGFFQDDGMRLAADLVLPAIDPTGTVVVCAGFRGGRRGGAAQLLARQLAAELGWAVLLLDYGGFGGSEGPRGRFDPEQQVRDIGSAVSYLLRRYPGRPASIYGNSFGAGMATVAAARDLRVASLFALCAFSSGSALMADQRPHWRLVEFREALETDRLERVLSGVSRDVEPDWVMVRDPEAAAYIARLAAAGGADRTPLAIADAERLTSFEPIADAPRLRGRPAIFIHCERDFFIPAWHSRALAGAAGAGCLILPGYGHYEIYEGEPQEALFRHAIEFYRAAVSGLPSA
jgi:pimeloyl-ACP methyl ester carboxylesterase